MCNIDGQSPLHVAAEGNFSSCVAALILAKADVNTSEYVIMFFIWQIVLPIISSRVGLYSKTDTTPVYKAAAVGGDGECIKLLIAAKANVTECNK